MADPRPVAATWIADLLCIHLIVAFAHDPPLAGNTVRAVNKTATVTGLAALMLAVGGCNGGDKSTGAGERTENRVDIAAGSDRDTNPSVEKYGEALAENDVNRMEQALKLVVRGSLAEAYLNHQIGGLVADQDAGYGSQTLDSSIEEIAGGFELCETTVLGGEACYSYTEFEFEDGRISSFEIDGQRLDDRLVMGDGTVLAIGELGSAKLLSAYQSMSGFLVVVMEVSAGAEGLRLSDFYNATYRSADGRQRNADPSSSFPTDLGPNSLVNVAIVFPETGRGGTLEVVFYGDDYLTEHGLTVPIP